MSTKVVTLKFEQQSVHEVGPIKKFFGLVKVINLIDLIDQLDLEANPRSSKVGSVTDAIRESMDTTPEIFAFKTKGILLGASSYQVRERNRIQVSFDNLGLEGILDGGHNTLAIGLQILTEALGTDTQVRKVKTWEDFRDLWSKSRTEVGALRGGRRIQDHSTGLEALMPIELIVPTDPDDLSSVEKFSQSLLDICSARNNNVQLRVEAKANQTGYFDYLQAVLPQEVAANVEWKTNEGGDVKAQDIVALSWIPLSRLGQFPTDDNGKQVSGPPPQNIYRSKGDCMVRFERLMSSPEVTKERNGKRILEDARVKSALDVSARFPEIHDWITEHLPNAYNKSGGKFGRITAVKKMNPENRRQLPKTKFTQKQVSTSIPEGFLIPFVYGIGALIETTPGGQVQWRQDPIEFLSRNFDKLVADVAPLIQILDFDPQKFGKEKLTYDMAVRAVETYMPKT